MELEHKSMTVCLCPVCLFLSFSSSLEYTHTHVWHIHWLPLSLILLPPWRVHWSRCFNLLPGLSMLRTLRVTQWTVCLPLIAHCPAPVPTWLPAHNKPLEWFHITSPHLHRLPPLEAAGHLLQTRHLSDQQDNILFFLLEPPFHSSSSLFPNLQQLYMLCMQYESPCNVFSVIVLQQIKSHT